MIYAVNKRTKEHRIVNDARDSNMLHEVIIQADADGWIGWKGGKFPLPDYVIADVKLYPRGNATGVAHGFWWGTTEGLSGTIIAYRPILNAEEKEMKQEWSGEGLPPVGIDCEFKLHHKDDSEYQWCYIVGESKDKKWLVFERGNLQTEVHNKQSGVYVFRARQSTREQWIKIACNEVDERAKEYNTNIDCSAAMRMTIEAIYDAGLAKLPEQTK